jgi:ABC-type multidrug transport system ATPase subunit
MSLIGTGALDDDDGTAQTMDNRIYGYHTLSCKEGAGSSRGQSSVTDVAGAEAANSRAAAEGLTRRPSLVQDLARAFTSESRNNQNGSVFIVEDDPNSCLNPNGPHFDPRAWALAVVDKIASSGGSFRTSGVCFQNMTVSGYSTGTRHQNDVANLWLAAVGLARKKLGYKKNRTAILHQFDGVLQKGEMLVVLGPPGSGCSTFLKTLAGETNGLFVDEQSYFNYQGITAREMHSQHRGDTIYTAEVDVHFPMLSVGETLTFASRARAPRHLPSGITPSMFSDHLRDVVMAMFGIHHTKNTRVGNEYIRGVSGGERKRVTICEAALSGAPFQCWDNSTRGLDSANAIEFCKTLKLQTEIFQTTCAVSIYQAPQSAYDLFDKTLVLYEGRQIFFGRANEARQYFINLGFECPERQTTPDFLTSMTSSKERLVRAEFENKAPRTPDEFAAAWRNSGAFQLLQAEIETYRIDHPIDGPDAETFRDLKREYQAKGQRSKSPYTLSYKQQIGLCLWRAYRRFVGDPSVTVGQLGANIVMGLIVSSIYYNLELTTGSFFQRSALLFFAVLMNAFSSALEILTLYAQRGIVEKHDRYAFYHPSAEAVASALMDMPYKVLNTIIFNVIICMSFLCVLHILSLG